MCGHRHVWGDWGSWSQACVVIDMPGYRHAWSLMCGHRHVWGHWCEACVVIDVPGYRHVWSLMCLVIGMCGQAYIYGHWCVLTGTCVVIGVCLQACVWSFMFLVTGMCGVIDVPGYMYGHQCSWSQACVGSLMLLVTGTCPVVTVSGHRHVWLLLCLVTGVYLIMMRYTCLNPSAMTECQTVRSCIQCWSFSERTDWKQAAAEENRGHRETDASNAG